MPSHHRWISLFLVGSAALTVGCGDEIICESGANCATGGGGSGASGGSNTGGSNTGGSNTGGSNTGGSNTGGSNTGGSNTGGSGGGGYDLSQVCDELCECDPGSCGADLQQCYQSVDDYVDTAIAAGCHEELAALEACAEDFVCLAGVIEPPSCLEPTSAALDDCVYGNPPPPTTVCDQASLICGAQPEPFECTGSAACAATCIVQLDSCDPNNPELASCLQGC